MARNLHPLCALPKLTRAGPESASGCLWRERYEKTPADGDNMPNTVRTAPRLGMTLVTLLALAPVLAHAAEVPQPAKGDTAWMLTATALVLLMSVPALALFYGGLVRSKNMLSVLMQVFVGFSLITVLWCVYGYSLASTFSKHTSLYELVYVAFQATFAAITCCLILGSLVERMRFSAVLLFLVIWFTFGYCPVAHMVWYWAGPDAYGSAAQANAANEHAGLIWQWGALDFAGGTVVHINAGVAGLVGAIVLGKRIGFGREPMAPHHPTMTMIGASLLWFRWV